MTKLVKENSPFSWVSSQVWKTSHFRHIKVSMNHWLRFSLNRVQWSCSKALYQLNRKTATGFFPPSICYGTKRKPLFDMYIVSNSEILFFHLSCFFKSLGSEQRELKASIKSPLLTAWWYLNPRPSDQWPRTLLTEPSSACLAVHPYIFLPCS